MDDKRMAQIRDTLDKKLDTAGMLLVGELLTEIKTLQNELEDKNEYKSKQ